MKSIMQCSLFCPMTYIYEITACGQGHYLKVILNISVNEVIQIKLKILRFMIIPTHFLANASETRWRAITTSILFGEIGYP